ncbi:MAG: aminoglycoside phosphotransferase family protein [Actinomycetota bacterium]|nr:aminoglycoside phosphotransferase family protein [Actinomycetota bacterium]
MGMLPGDPREMIVTVNEDEITPDVAARLVAAQFPQWAGLPVTPVAFNGRDNTTFRLGDELCIRLPSASCVPQVAKEHRWLPVLARQLPLPIPEPVAIGCPGAGFPRPWSVYRWIEGEPASVAQVADLTAFASGLAGFLAALHAADASDGPPAGAHNFFRGGPLATWDEQTRQLIRLAADDIDAEATASVWDTALASTCEQAPVWVHGDLTASNMLVADGALHAVIDFGGVAVGDPAYDLVMKWEFFTGDSAAAFRRGLSLDDATWARARGWALWKALVNLATQKTEGIGGQAAARHLGWRHSPTQTIGLLIADLRCR